MIQYTASNTSECGVGEVVRIGPMKVAGSTVVCAGAAWMLSIIRHVSDHVTVTSDHYKYSLGLLRSLQL